MAHCNRRGCRYPYTLGHTLVLPYAHNPSLESLPTIAAELSASASRCVKLGGIMDLLDHFRPRRLRCLARARASE